MKKYTLLILLVSIIHLYAEEADSSNKSIWTPGAVAGLNISQLSLTNWKQGGENSFSWTFVSNWGLRYEGHKWNLRNNLKLAYGRTKLGGKDFRTNDNELYLESVLSRNVGWAVDPYISNTVRTAITEGFNYKKDPPERIANFFDPGYITQSIGFTYDKLKFFRTRFGIAVQETFTSKYRQYTTRKETPDMEETFMLETGVESVASGEYKLDTNILFKSSLRLFSRFESLDVWDIRWDTTINAKVNSYINVGFNLLVVYEKSQTVKTQIKQGLQVGLTYNII